MATAITRISAPALRLYGRIESPLVERELTAISRRRIMYVMRGIWAGYIAIGIVLYVLIPDLDQTQRESLAGFLERSIELTAALQLCAVAVGALLSPSLIAREQENRTLPLLIMAGFRPRDIYSAKFLGVYLPIMFVVLLPLPIYTIAAALDVPVQRALLGLIPLALFGAAACALGLAVSTICRKPGDALLIAIPVFAAWAAIPWAYAVYVTGALNPTAFHGAFALTEIERFSFADWMVLLLIHSAIFVASVLVSLAVLPNRAHAVEAVARPRKLRRRDKPIRGNAAIHFARANAVGLGALLRNPYYGALFAVALLGLALYNPYFAIAPTILLSYDVAASAAKAGRDGVLLGMLLMPIDDRVCARDLLYAYFRHVWMYMPAIIAGMVLIAMRMEFIIWPEMGFARPRFPSMPPEALAPLGLIAGIAGIAAAVLAATNLSLQGASAIYAAIVGALAFAELTFAGIVAGNIAGMFVQSKVYDNGFVYAAVLTFTVLVTWALFYRWYYPRYFNSLRAALFEDTKRKRQNW